ncbi:MAG: hypothetical protein HRT89_02645 [Lentisphaeria bacterium]|nr:hypothetical protein [Lentisphaeria bacterium]
MGLWWDDASPMWWDYSVIYKIAWLFPMPMAVFAFLGLIWPVTKKELFTPRLYKRFYILVVTKGTNVEAARRSFNAMKHLQTDLVKLIFITDNPLPFPCVVVPEDFVPDHARYKARALEYFRLKMKLGQQDWRIASSPMVTVRLSHNLQDSLDFFINANIIKCITR